MLYLVLKGNDREIELIFPKIPCKLSCQQHMLAGDMALMVECLSLVSSVLSTETNTRFENTSTIL